MILSDLDARAARHGALADRTRLAIVDALACSDRSPAELRALLGIESNLLAHHLDTLESVALIERRRSSGDKRRRYVHLVHRRLAVPPPAIRLNGQRALFVCTRNSARSQLAAALWQAMTGRPARSAGTHPAPRVHPGAVAAATRAGLDLSRAVPRSFERGRPPAGLVVTVCDQAHEELGADPARLHWSVADPLADGRRGAFDRTVRELRERITALTIAPGEDVR